MLAMYMSGHLLQGQSLGRFGQVCQRARRRLADLILAIFALALTSADGPWKCGLPRYSDRWCGAFCDQLAGGDTFAVDHIKTCTDNDGNAGQGQCVREIVEHKVA